MSQLPWEGTKKQQAVAETSGHVVGYSLLKHKESLEPPEFKECPWANLIDWFRAAPEQPTKEDCPLVKFALFGSKRTIKADGKLGSYRNDANVISVTGIEVDYDAGIIQPDEAIARLEARQIRAFVYTSYSHRSDTPRWRAIIPFKHRTEPVARLPFVEAINGVFDGAIAPESATLSQSYFVGRPPQGDYRVLVTFDDPEDGFCLDEIDDCFDWRVPFRVTQKEAIGYRTGEESEALANEAFEELLSGKSVHDSLRHLVGRWVAKGLRNSEIRSIFAVVARQVAETRGEKRAADIFETGELERAIQGAHDKGYAPPDADISALIENLTEKAPVIDPLSAPIIHPEKIKAPEHLLEIPGVLQEGVDWLLKNSKKPQPIYAVQAMIALGATVMGRRFRTDQDNWPSLFLPVLGLSATGKESIKYGIETLLTQAGLDELIGPSRYTSDSGLLSSLIQQPSHISISDEFGKILASSADQGNIGLRSMLRMMMEVWGRVDGVLRPIGYATAGLRQEDIDQLNARIVHNPALTFVGLATPDSFFDALTRGALVDGFVNRMLIVQCDEDRRPSVFRSRTDTPDALVDWSRTNGQNGIQSGSQFIPMLDPASAVPTNVRVVPFSAEAMARIGQFDEWCIEQMNDLQAEGLAELYGRTNEIAMRLALVVAVSCGADEISLAHFDWATAYVSYWTARVVNQARLRVSDGINDAAMRDVERLLGDIYPLGLSMREIRQRSRKFAALNPRGRIDVLQALKHESAIDVRKVSTKTKPREEWYLIRC